MLSKPTLHGVNTRTRADPLYPLDITLLRMKTMMIAVDTDGIYGHYMMGTLVGMVMIDRQIQ